ncbi:MAG: hypothetical protein Q7U39_07825 [Nitrospira sp.]|nr:hypothetical protein [Nitrospira sp.]
MPILLVLCGGLGFFLAKLLENASSASSTLASRIFLLSYSLNVLVVFALYYYYLADHGTTFLATELNPHDDAHFHHIGTTIARDWIDGTSRSQIPLKGYTYKGYPLLLGGIYYFANLFGDMSPIAPRIVNAMCGGLLSAAVFSLANLSYNSTVAIRAAILAIFFPTFWLYSGNTLRDIIIALLVTVSTILVLKLQRATTGVSRLTLFAAFAFALLGVFLLRSSTFFALVAAVTVYFGVFAKSLLSKALLVGTSLILLAVGFLYGKELGAPPPESLLGQPDHYTEMVVTSASKESLAIRYIYKAPAYLFLPLNAVYTAFAPVPPIKSTYLPHVIEGLGAIVWYFCIPFWALGMYYGLRSRQSILPVLVTLVLFVAIATIAASARHKTLFQGLALVHVAEASMRLTGRVMSINLLVSLILCVLAVIYMFLKF